MTLATSCSITLSPTKRRQLKIHAERLYEDKFHARWIADPSAKATRNKYRQLLSQTTGSKFEPIINTLIRGDYYGKDNAGPRKERLKPFGIIAKNKLLQVQSQLSATQKRQLSKLLSERSITEDTLRTSHNSIRSDSGNPEKRRCQEHAYWSALDYLNRKRRIDFHHRGVAKTRESAVALAMTDSSYIQGKHECNKVIRDICEDFDDDKPSAQSQQSADQNVVSIADVEKGRLRKNIVASKDLDSEINNNCRRADQITIPRKTISSSTVSTKVEIAEQKASAASSPRLDRAGIATMVNRVHSGQQPSCYRSETRQRDVGESKYHHIGITDHSHKKVWKNLTKFADQRVPIIATDIPQGL